MLPALKFVHDACTKLFQRLQAFMQDGSDPVRLGTGLGRGRNGLLVVITGCQTVQDGAKKEVPVFNGDVG